MPNAALDNLILSPSSLAAGAAASSPPLGTGRDFGDELKRAGQPLADSQPDSQPDSNDTSSDNPTTWSSADSSLEVQTDFRPDSSADRTASLSDHTWTYSNSSSTDRSSKFDSDNNHFVDRNRSSSETQSGNSQPRDRDDRTHGSDNSKDKSSTDATTSSSAGQPAVTKSPVKDRDTSQDPKDSDAEQGADKNAAQNAAATTTEGTAAAELLTAAQSGGQAEGQTQAAAGGNSATASTAANTEAAPVVNGKEIAAGEVAIQTGSVAAKGAGKSGPGKQTSGGSGSTESSGTKQNADASAISESSKAAASAAAQISQSSAETQAAAQAQTSSLSPATSGAQAETAGATTGVAAKGRRQNQTVDNSADPNQINQTATINMTAVADATTGVAITDAAATTTEKRDTTTGRAADAAIQSAADANQPASLSTNSQTANANAAASNSPGRLATGGADDKFTVVGQRTAGAQVDQVRFVQRVANAFKAADEQGGQIRLRLSPPELGALKVEVSVRNGTLSARLETENSTTRSLLLDSLPALRERLSGQNIKIDRFDVDLKQDGAGNGSANLPPDFSGSRQDSSPGQNSGRVTAKRSDAGISSPGVGSSDTLGTGQINILI
jgi:flagellar hook-length control protein FliK